MTGILSRTRRGVNGVKALDGCGRRAYFNRMTHADLTLQEWLRRLALDWQLERPQLARLIRMDEERLAAELNRPTSEANAGPTIPPGFDCAPALIRIYQLLAARFQKTEDQLKWLFTANQDFGGEKPIDVAASSRENLFWIAYYLDTRSAESVGKKQTD